MTSRLEYDVNFQNAVFEVEPYLTLTAFDTFLRPTIQLATILGSFYGVWKSLIEAQSPFVEWNLVQNISRDDALRRSYTRFLKKLALQFTSFRIYVEADLPGSQTLLQRVTQFAQTNTSGWWFTLFSFMHYVSKRRQDQDEDDLYPLLLAVVQKRQPWYTPNMILFKSIVNDEKFDLGANLERLLVVMAASSTFPRVLGELYAFVLERELDNEGALDVWVAFQRMTRYKSKRKAVVALGAAIQDLELAFDAPDWLVGGILAPQQCELAVLIGFFKNFSYRTVKNVIEKGVKDNDRQFVYCVLKGLYSDVLRGASIVYLAKASLTAKNTEMINVVRGLDAIYEVDDLVGTVRTWLLADLNDVLVLLEGADSFSKGVVENVVREEFPGILEVFTLSESESDLYIPPSQAPMSEQDKKVYDMFMKAFEDVEPFEQMVTNDSGQSSSSGPAFTLPDDWFVDILDQEEQPQQSLFAPPSPPMAPSLPIEVTRYVRVTFDDGSFLQ